MRKNYLAMLAAAAAFSLSGFAVAPASALPVAKPSVAVKSDVVKARINGGQHWRGGNNWRGNNWRGNNWRGGGYRHNRGFYGSRLFIAPYYGYSSYRGGGGGCYWLKRKAINTGSRYWRHRYEQCRWG